MDKNKIIKSIRVNANISQREFARRLKASPATISYIESGKIEVSDKFMKRVEEIFSPYIAEGESPTEGNLSFIEDTKVIYKATKSMPLGEIVRYQRRVNNLTQGELGEAIGVTRSAVASWEAGQVEPTIEKIKAICNYFDISACELLGLVCYEEDSGLYHAIKVFTELNREGKKKAYEYLMDISELKKYKD